MMYVTLHIIKKSW